MKEGVFVKKKLFNFFTCSSKLFWELKFFKNNFMIEKYILILLVAEVVLLVRDNRLIALLIWDMLPSRLEKELTLDFSIFSIYPSLMWLVLKSSSFFLTASWNWGIANCKVFSLQGFIMVFVGFIHDFFHTCTN